MAKMAGVVDVLVSGEAAEDGLSEQLCQCVPAIPASACVGEHFARHRAETECVVEFSISDQSSVGSDDRSAKLDHQPSVEIEPENRVVRFTRRVPHDRSLNAQIAYCFL